VRFSHPNQRLGDSARRQFERAQEYCRLHGLTLDVTLRDEGKSAYKGDHIGERSALGALLRAVRTGQVEAGTVLVVETFDRLSRQDVTIAIGQFLQLLEAGIVVVTLMDGQRYDLASVNANPMTLQYSVMLMATANSESRTKADRLSKTWHQKRKLAETDKKRLSSACPGWLVPNERDGFDIDEAKAATVRRIYDMVIGGFGAMLVARALNADGVPLIGTSARSARSKGWAQSTVKYLVANRATEGIFIPHIGRLTSRTPGEPIIDYFPRIIDPDLAQKARASMASRRNAGAGRRGEAANLLSGIAACGECNGAMAYIRGGPGRPDYLRCSAAVRGAGCSNGTRHLYRHVEKAVLAEALFLAVDPPAAPDPASGLRRELAEIDTRRSVMRVRIARLLESLEDGDEGIVAVRDRLRERQADLVALNEDAARVVRAIDEAQGRVATADFYEVAASNIRDLQNPTIPADRRLALRLGVRDALRRIVDIVWCEQDDRTAMVWACGMSISFAVDTRSGAVSMFGYHIAGQTRFRRENGKVSAAVPTPEVVLRLQERMPRRVDAGLRRMGKRIRTQRSEPADEA